MSYNFLKSTLEFGLLSKFPIFAYPLRNLSINSFKTSQISVMNFRIGHMTNARRLSSNYPSHKFANLPSLSPTMDKGNIATWSKKEGDKLDEGDTLCEIETDKAVMPMETPISGFLAKILHPGGTKNININQPIAIIVKRKEDVDAFKDFKLDGNSTQPTSAEPIVVKPTVQEHIESTKVESIPVVKKEPTHASNRIFVSPYAKKLAHETGTDISRVSGSGPSSRIIAKDIPQSPQNTAQKLSKRDNYTDVEISTIRNVIAKRLTMSKSSIPHFYVNQDINMDAVVSLRSEIKSKWGNRYKISINDFVIKAASLALQDVPQCNSHWMDSFIREYKSIDICVAVSTPSGLITPIVFDANHKSLSVINHEVNVLAEKARNNKLIPQEFQGGTFTVSNLGMFGTTSFTAIINPPQSCILSVGTTQKRLILDENDLPIMQSYMVVTLGCDHRVVDGAIGASWLMKFKEYMENPFSMLL